MLDALKIRILLALPGCASAPPPGTTASACAAAANSYGCQAIRYLKASGPP